MRSPNLVHYKCINNIKEDPKQALENYKKALSLGSSQSIKDVYDAAGIRFDFSGETIKELMLFVKRIRIT